MTSEHHLAWKESSKDIVCVAHHDTERLDCDHVMKYFADNTDLVMIWDWFPCCVKIPISSERNIWALVMIDFFNGLTDKALVKWGMHDIAIISKNEGRLVIRTALLNFMYGDYNRKSWCQSTGHSPSDERRWFRDTESGSTSDSAYVAQMWSVYTTGLCLGCDARLHLVFDDAIPPREGINVWNK